MNYVYNISMDIEKIGELSGILLVSCDDNEYKVIIKKAKATQGVTSVFQPKNKQYIHLVINMQNASKEEIINAKNVIGDMKGVKSIEYRITK